MKKLLSLLFFAVIGTTVAQTSGKLSYALDFSSDNPDMAMALQMMQGSTMDLYFIPDKTKMAMNMGIVMKMDMVTDVKADKGLMLMEMMGNKTATELKLTDIAKEDKAQEPKVETTSETKTIIGFKCTKMIVRDAQGLEVVMWVTRDLKASLKGQKQFASTAIDGVPLEFSTVTNGMTVHFVATKFDKQVDAKIFSLAVPEGYKVTTVEDLKKMGLD